MIVSVLGKAEDSKHKISVLAHSMKPKSAAETQLIQQLEFYIKKLPEYKSNDTKLTSPILWLDQKISIKDTIENSKHTTFEYQDIALVFTTYKFSSDNRIIYQYDRFPDDEARYLREIVLNVINNVRYGDYFRKNIERFISKLIDAPVAVISQRERASFDINDYLGPCENVVQDLYNDFKSAPVLNNFRARKQIPANFLFAIKLSHAATNKNKDAVRLVIPKEQQLDICEYLRKSHSISEARTSEIMELAQEPIYYEDSIGYGSLPFQESLGFWNLRQNDPKVMGVQEQEKYNCRRIIYAAISQKISEKELSERELISFGDNLAIAVFPFHVVGSPYAHVIQVTDEYKSYEQINKFDESERAELYKKWEDNTLMYSSFIRAFSRKFRARLRTEILKSIRSKARTFYQQNSEIGQDQVSLRKSHHVINEYLRGMAATYPIRGYKLATSNSASNLPIGQWGQKFVNLKLGDNNFFFKNYLKKESTYSLRVLLALRGGMNEARNEIVKDSKDDWFKYLRKISDYYKNCSAILFVSGTKSYFDTNCYDIAYDWFDCHFPGVEPIFKFQSQEDSELGSNVVQLHRIREARKPTIFSLHKLSSAARIEVFSSVLDSLLNKNYVKTSGFCDKIFTLKPIEQKNWESILSANSFDTTATDNAGNHFWRHRNYTNCQIGLLNLDSLYERIAKPQPA